MGLLVSNCNNPCQCGAGCHFVGVTSSGVISPDQKIWHYDGSPSTTLVNPSACFPSLVFTVSQHNSPTVINQPGIMVYNTFNGHNFSAFDWTYTIVYDGTGILTESGHFPGGSTEPVQGNAYLVFLDPGWFLNGPSNNKYWEWDYGGPSSGNMNPPVQTTLSILAPIDTIVRPGLPIWSYASQ